MFNNMEEKSEREPPTYNDFEFIVSTFQTRIYRFIQKLVKDAELSADLLQDTLFATYVYLENHDMFGKDRDAPEYIREIQPLIYKIARNKAFDELRRRKSIQFVSFQTAPPPSGLSSSWQEDLNPAIEFIIGGAGSWRSCSLETQTILADELKTAIEQIGRKKLLNFFLYLDGFSYNEIGQLTGDSIASVKSKIHRCKQSLRQAMSD